MIVRLVMMARARFFLCFSFLRQVPVSAPKLLNPTYPGLAPRV
jgi:hypothetical protein